MSIRFFGVLVVIGACLGVSFAGDVATGKVLYDKKCRICHGEMGEGNPDVAQKLKADQKPLYADEVQKKTDADFRKIIAEGTGKMKPPKNVSDADMDNIIAFVRTLKKP
jgi:mono/diheme cytochrome c family protein